MDQNFLFFRTEDSMLLSTADTTFAHNHTSVHLHTNAAPDLSGPAKPIEGSWRFICHSNVFLGKVPARGEPGVQRTRYSGSTASRTKGAPLCHCPILHLCAHVFVHMTGDAISQIYGN